MAARDWYCEDVLSGELNVDRLYEDDRVIAFHHPYPSARPHVVVTVSYTHLTLPTTERV